MTHSSEVLVGQGQRPHVENNFHEEKQMKIKNKSLFLIGSKKCEAYTMMVQNLPKPLIINTLLPIITLVYLISQRKKALLKKIDEVIRKIFSKN
jgi:hypothetical protein